MRYRSAQNSGVRIALQREGPDAPAHLVVAVRLEDVEDGIHVFEVVHACTCPEGKLSVVFIEREGPIWAPTFFALLAERHSTLGTMSVSGRRSSACTHHDDVQCALLLGSGHRSAGYCLSCGWDLRATVAVGGK